MCYLTCGFSRRALFFFQVSCFFIFYFVSFSSFFYFTPFYQNKLKYALFKFMVFSRLFKMILVMGGIANQTQLLPSNARLHNTAYNSSKNTATYAKYQTTKSVFPQLMICNYFHLVQIRQNKSSFVKLCLRLHFFKSLKTNVSRKGYRDVIVINQLMRKYSQTKIFKCFLGACSIVTLNY